MSFIERSTLSRGFACERGSIAIPTGLVFLMLAAGAGAALDYTRAVEAKLDLQDTADAAVLVAATAAEGEASQRASSFFLNSEFCQRHTCDAPTVKEQNGEFTIAASAKSHNMMMQLVGMQSITINVEARAMPPRVIPADVVMMLDYSGSMDRDLKYVDMAAAASNFLKQAEDRSGDTVQVGLVPFSKYVLAPLEGRYLYDVAGATDMLGIGPVIGCILNREHPHSTSVATPQTGLPGSLWPVYSYASASDPGVDSFSPDYGSNTVKEMIVPWEGVDYTLEYFDTKPDSGRSEPHVDYDPNEVELGGSNELAMRWKGTAPPDGEYQFEFPADWPPDPSPYNGYAGSDQWSAGDDSGLPKVFAADKLAEALNPECAKYASNRVWSRPLSRDFADMRTAIDLMRPMGATNIALALDLGWHMLSENAPFSEASGEENTKRIAILLTDGVQTVEAHGAGDLISVSSANDNIGASCASMKADGIDVFAIAFGIKDKLTRDLLRACSSGDPFYFEPKKGGELDSVFKAIFEQINASSVRLSG